MLARASHHPQFRAAFILLTMGLPLGACSSSRLGVHSPLDVSSAPRGALVTVTNQNPQDVRVYVVRGGSRIPLGSLGTGERRSFPVPSSVLGASGGFRLQADPLGGSDAFTSDWIPATTGDHVEWTVAHRLKFSHFSVRPRG